MRFICSVEIDLPVAKVIELFDNVDNIKEWQDGFVSYEHLSGTPGEPGATSRLVYQTEGGEIELIETIVVKNLPEEFIGTYEAKSMVNTMRNSFTSLGENKTRYDTEIEYTAFYGFIPKMMAFLMPGLFRKQTQKWLNQFKVFAEKEAMNTQTA
ncbi:SRPBCC family protein [Fulvivirgaceae bacterium BMA10]|uniref:SRPBCC family protein n=1 Tax=Splendidivirga corallicola TaxID=3051826 RepID=A0ABT8KHR2_9BACT|nr:SRPBCC family protein [Fulvivirgaceae bacterium BMA10]